MKRDSGMTAPFSRGVGQPVLRESGGRRSGSVEVWGDFAPPSYLSSPLQHKSANHP